MRIALHTFMPHLRGLRVDHVDVADQLITLTLTTIRPTAPCPVCQRRSSKIHSRYARTIAALPWSGVRVCLHVQTRRFVGTNMACERKVFCERLPALTAVYGRQTHLLRATLRRLGFALGGNAGARLAQAQSTPASRTTLLHRVRTAPPVACAAPRVRGVDDFALRRGQRYGTLVVDLERPCPVDLWPDRAADAFAAWLALHPGSAVISRDRGESYAEGARRGAPDAVQGADRFHLVPNVRAVVEQVLARRQAALRPAALTVAAAAADAATPEVVPPPDEEGAAAPADLDAAAPLTRAQQLKQANRARRFTRYKEVMARRDAGLSLSAIARTMGLGRQTVQHYVRAASFPERRERAPRPTLLTAYDAYLRMLTAYDAYLRMLTAYDAYLRQRGSAGCQDAAALWRAIHALGFTGHPVTVRQHVRPWRAEPLPPGWPHQRPLHPAPPPPRRVTVSQATWLLRRAPDDLEEEDRAYVATLTEVGPAVAGTQRLAQLFLALVRTQDVAALEPWLRAAEASAIPEFGGVAAGLRRDQAAVLAALQLPWNNGQTEGQINRLKMLKRQLYGRANFDLLRQRVLYAA